MALIDLAHLKTTLKYDPETGIWTSLTGNRTTGNNQIRAGERADRKFFNGMMNYQRIAYQNKRYYSHRLAFFYMTGRWPIGIDHKDRNGTNNRWTNLREATQKQNLGNRRLSKRNKSGHVGVYWDKCRKKWIARLGRTFFNKRFKTKAEAIKAYTTQAEIYFEGYYVAP